MTPAQFILKEEARRDASGRLAVYRLPAGDGGGSFEVAGINDKYHPAEANALRSLIAQGRHAEAELRALGYIAEYVAGPAGWSNRPGPALFIADTAFNRGAGGAAWVLQAALGFSGAALDGAYGPKTAAALREAEGAPRQLVHNLRAARERYERTPVPRFGKGARDESSPFWRGLAARWDRCLVEALKLESENAS
jgi:hypothetical protein